MYNTTSVIDNSPNDNGTMSGNCFDDAASLSSDKVSRRRYCSCSKVTSDCFIIQCLSFMFCCPLILVIGVGIVALILDKRDFLSSCGIVWPLLTGVFILGVLYIILMRVLYCILEKYSKEARKPIIITKVSFSDEGYQQFPIKYIYELDPFLKLSYLLLIFLLLCVVIGSGYFFSSGYACYKELREGVEELMLGYQILFYASIVVFSILGCIFSCFIHRIMIKSFCKATNSSSVWEIVCNCVAGGFRWPTTTYSWIILPISAERQIIKRTIRSL